jgi:hypothetical protein
VGPLEDFADLHCTDFTHTTARVARHQLRQLEVDPYAHALVRRGICGAKDEGEDNDRLMVVGMQYSGAIRVMVLDKMSKSEDKLEEVEQRLARVEDVTATNDNVQNVEMTLGGEIAEVRSDLRDALRHWGDHTQELSREWDQERLVMVTVMQAQQCSLETLHACVRSLMDNVGVLQERELARVHHAGNPLWWMMMRR